MADGKNPEVPAVEPDPPLIDEVKTTLVDGDDTDTGSDTPGPNSATNLKAFQDIMANFGQDGANMNDWLPKYNELYVLIYFGWNILLSCHVCYFLAHHMVFLFIP